MDAISCPFCNATFNSDQPRQAGARMLCPRCGELLPVHLAGTLSHLAAPTSPAPLPQSVRLTNRKVALVVVGVMLLMAAAGLTLALATVKWRRQNDYRVKRDASPPA